MYKFALYRIVSLGLLFSLLPGALAASDKTASKEFTGRAPDLGAYEAGSPGPHYGPRR